MVSRSRAGLVILPAAVVLYLSIRILIDGEVTVGRGRSGTGQPMTLYGSDAVLLGWFGIAIALLLIGICLAILLRKTGR